MEKRLLKGCQDTVASANISLKKTREHISQLHDDASITADMENCYGCNEIYHIGKLQC